MLDWSSTSEAQTKLTTEQKDDLKLRHKIQLLINKPAVVEVVHGERG